MGNSIEQTHCPERALHEVPCDYRAVTAFCSAASDLAQVDVDAVLEELRPAAVRPGCVSRSFLNKK